MNIAQVLKALMFFLAGIVAVWLGNILIIQTIMGMMEDAFMKLIFGYLVIIIYLLIIFVKPIMILTSSEEG